MFINRALSNIAATLCACAIPTLALAQEEPPRSGTIGGLNTKNEKEEIIEPEKKSEPVRVAAIDTEKFELGFFLGTLSVEDFSTHSAWGISFSYHITPKIITQVNRGQASVGKATFEERDNQIFLADEDRDFTYTSILGGYQVLHGRSFLGKRTKLNSAIYFLAGLGQVEFAGNSSTSYEFGTSYRTVVTDWLTLNVDIRDHIFDRDFIDENKTTHNVELVVGLNFLF